MSTVNSNASKYVTLRDYYNDSYKKMDGENAIFKNGKTIDVGMFTRGKTVDGKKYNFDDGCVFIQEKDGSTTKLKKLGFDTDGDGINDVNYRISSLQNCRVKGRKAKYNSEYINEKLADIATTGDPDKKQRKLDHLRKKLLNAGIAEDVIDKKFNIQNPEIKLKAPIELSIKVPEFKIGGLKELDKESMRTNFYDRQKADNTKADETLAEKAKQPESYLEKYKKYTDMIALEEQNQKDARRLLIDPNLREYLKENPKVMQALLTMV